MADKKKLTDMLPNSPQPPVIRRGQGFRLSTDAPSPTTSELSVTTEETEKRGNEEIEKRGNEEIEKRTLVVPKREKVERVKPGYEIRKDLLQAVKRLAIDEDRFNYEIVEEALEEYLRNKGKL